MTMSSRSVFTSFVLCSLLLPSMANAQVATTAYGASSVANSVSSVEEANLMARMRTLRARSALVPSQSIAPSRQGLIKPLQETGDALTDLRSTTKAPVITNGHGTTYNYRSVSPLMYSATPTDSKKKVIRTETEHGFVESTYDETMRLAEIGAGAANMDVRGEAPRQRVIVPNMADRVGTSFAKFSGDLAGQGEVFATATGHMPRRVATPLTPETIKANQAYRGQPLQQLSNNPGSLGTMTVSAPPGEGPTVYSSPSTPVSSSGLPLSLTNNTTQATSAAPVADAPVIYGADGQPLPAVEQPKPVQKPFTYQKIDQSKGLTTPQLGSSSVSIPQKTNYALPTTASTMNFGRYVPDRKPTETGTLLWTDSESKAAAEKETVVPVSAAKESYGSKAVPLISGSADQRWGFFLTGNTGFGSNELLKNSSKTKTVTTGLTAGVDYHIQGNSYAGLALTYVHNSLTTGATSDLQSNSTSLSLYGTTTYADNAYLDGYLSAGYHSLSSERDIVSGKAKGDTSGYRLAGKAETGYDFKQNALTYGPYLGMRLAYADFDGYTETNAGTGNLKTSGFDNFSAISSLGIGGSYKHTMSNGGALLPALRMAYNHEFGDDKTSIKAEFAGTPSSALTTDGAKKSTDWISITPSITASLPNDWTLAAQYEHEFFRDDSNENIFALTAQRKW